MAAAAESDYQPESTSGNHDTKKKNRENNHHILLAKNIFFADDNAIDKNFKNKKLQLKQKGVR